MTIALPDPSVVSSSGSTTIDSVTSGRRSRRRRLYTVCGVLVTLNIALFAAMLMFGNTFYPPGDVLSVILGQEVQGASFTVGELRLPRGVTAIVVGACFGMAGVSFQILLRNSLAAPDIVGISDGAGAAAVFAILMLDLSPNAVAVFAVVGGLVTAAVIYVLAYVDGMVGTRLILMGIAISAMLQAFISYLIVRAAQWDLQVAMRWLTGSLNASRWEATVPVVLACMFLMPLLLAQSRKLDLMRHGEDTASALGVNVERTRVVVIIVAVALIALATSAAGPIAFVAFLAGPIAAQMVGGSQPLMIPSALVGMTLVLASDLVGQYLFQTRFPVGVITGVMGAPYLVYLLIRLHRAGSAL
ncbi:MAG: iron chelate uptake ABC transporter family permease subunit [Actinomycetota bacterium]